MRLILQYLLLVIGCLSCHGDEPFQAAGANPKLTINSVKRDSADKSLLAVSVTIEADGEGRLALAQNQFTLLISNEKNPWLFSAEAIFPNEFAKNFEVPLGKPITVTIKADKAISGEKASWQNLPNGIYQIQVRLNSFKGREFDFHWLGQTYSEGRKIKLPLAEQDAVE